MNVSLNIHMEKYINEKVKEGNYNSASEVIREALRLLMERENISKQVNKLNQDIELGLLQLSKNDGIEGKSAFEELRILKKNKF